LTKGGSNEPPFFFDILKPYFVVMQWTIYRRYIPTLQNPHAANTAQGIDQPTVPLARSVPHDGPCGACTCLDFNHASEVSDIASAPPVNQQHLYLIASLQVFPLFSFSIRDMAGVIENILFSLFLF
jgi:hypothetical protein